LELEPSPNLSSDEINIPEPYMSLDKLIIPFIIINKERKEQVFVIGMTENYRKAKK